MRICLVTLDFTPFRSSGLTVYVERLARRLAERGHQITVIAADRPKTTQADVIPMPDNVQVLRVPVGSLDWIALGWQAARYLHWHRSDFDVIHFADVHFAYAYSDRFVASAFQSFRQRLTSHRGRPYYSNWRNYLFRLIYYNVARRMMEQPAVRRATFLIMSSATTQQEFIKYYQVDPARTVLIYPGIDLSRFEGLPEQDKARRYLGLPSDGPILLYVGFSTPRKGVEYLAQALTRMKTPAYLVMVGKWEPNYQQRFLDALGDTIARVRLVGYVPEADLPIYFAAADVFVLPTLLEGFGIPLVEAMAAGLPVVTTRGGAASEVVGDAGIVVPAGDSEALARALDYVLTDPDVARQLRYAGRHRARTMFDDRRAAAEVEVVYSRFMDQL
ncbi:MAG TPA: glycosyltransferase family 4 protein [Thermoflexus sp.]|nr:glycosyltransferase family 4 protein [Thermoflexus sp.]